MKILSKSTQKEIIDMMLANAIIAIKTAYQFKTTHEYLNIVKEVADNLREAAYGVAGEKAMKRVLKNFYENVPLIN